MSKHDEKRPVSTPGEGSSTRDGHTGDSAKPLPPHGNTGVESATPSGGTNGSADEAQGSDRRSQPGFTIEGVRSVGEPEDYFYSLGVDTLQIAVRGSFRDRGKVEKLRKLRESAEAHRNLGFGLPRFEAPSERRLQVFPHGARPCYDILMRDGDGLEVRALPKLEMPTFILRFGARWCFENSITDLGNWAIQLVRSLNFEPEKVQLSEVHIRCDVPTPFTNEDMKRMRGVGTRNGSFNTHWEKARLSGIDNLGGEKTINFNIYNKRLEQSKRERVFWPAVWASFGVRRDQPIWRVEARWRRDSLLAFGLDWIGELTEEAIRGLWYDFSSRYLLFVSDLDLRTSRTDTLPKWKRIQHCGTMMEATPIVASVDVTDTQLIKQSVGCAARALALMGAADLKREARRIINHVADAAEMRCRGSLRQCLKDVWDEVIEKWPDDVALDREKMKKKMFDFIESSLFKKPVASTYEETDAKGEGGAR